ncbi:hypothetical protein X798_05580 [Onchocerca flexuosa]|uniref:Uncharacterized protein n=1 Tax=Onchocerca flexuosa TaxID=387005 RepID=A0A238BQ72_9BILA|nr:hypothetical protein X798_05580 [Onchocerca flexuosa]
MKTELEQQIICSNVFRNFNWLEQLRLYRKKIEERKKVKNIISSRNSTAKELSTAMLKEIRKDEENAKWNLLQEAME